MRKYIAAIGVGLSLISGCSQDRNTVCVPDLGDRWKYLNSKARKESVRVWDASTEEDKSLINRIYNHPLCLFDGLSQKERIEVASLEDEKVLGYRKEFPWIAEPPTTEDRLLIYAVEEIRGIISGKSGGR